MQQRNAQLTLAKAKQAAGLDTLEGRLSWHSLRHSAGSVWLTEHGSQFMRQDMPWWDSRSDRTSLTFQSAIQTLHRKPRPLAVAEVDVRPGDGADGRIVKPASRPARRRFGR